MENKVIDCKQRLILFLTSGSCLVVKLALTLWLSRGVWVHYSNVHACFSFRKAGLSGEAHFNGEISSWFLKCLKFYNALKMIALVHHIWCTDVLISPMCHIWSTDVPISPMCHIWGIGQIKKLNNYFFA